MKRYRTLALRALVTALCLLLYWRLSVTPLPGLNATLLHSYLTQHSSKTLALLTMVSGNGLTNGSLLFVGIMPLMLIQMFVQMAQTGLIPAVKRMSEGTNGNGKIAKLGVLLAIPINALVAFVALKILGKMIPGHLVTGSTVKIIILATAGGLIGVTLAELISLFGLGQGLTVLIAWGIFLSLAEQHKQAQLLIMMMNQKLGVSTFHAWYMIIGLVVALNVLFFILQTVTYNVKLQFVNLEHVEQQTGVLPFMLNVANIMPLIMTSIAFSLLGLLLPKYGGLFSITSIPSMHLFITTVFFMTIIMTFVQFPPQNIVDSFEMNGTFILGIAPGQATKRYLTGVLLGLSVFNAVIYVLLLGTLMTWLINRGFSPQLVMNISSIMIIVMTVANIFEQVLGILSEKQRPALITERGWHHVAR